MVISELLYENICHTRYFYSSVKSCGFCVWFYKWEKRWKIPHLVWRVRIFYSKIPRKIKWNVEKLKWQKFNIFVPVIGDFENLYLYVHKIKFQFSMYFGRGRGFELLKKFFEDPTKVLYGMRWSNFLWPLVSIFINFEIQIECTSN